MNRFLRRAARARALALRYPESGPALEFFAAVSEFQASGLAETDLRRLVARIGPPVLAAAAQKGEKHAWFERVLKEMGSPCTPGLKPRPNQCPQCGSPPQLGILTPQGHGAALELACSLCRRQWPFPRIVCPGCGESSSEKIALWSADRFPSIRTQTCDSCQAYFHVIDLGTEPEAVAEADEVAAQPLDVWAMESGYRKLCPNLVGL